MNKTGMGERSPWGDFPAVVRNAGLGDLKKEPDYLTAKSGDMPAAIALVERLLTDDTVARIKALAGRERPVLLPVLAVEQAGNNKIPLAMAAVLREKLGWDIETGIVQRERIARTGKGADYRMAFNPTFAGEVKSGTKYLVLDDTLTMGGTVASLRGYVENRGGKVIGASVMTAHEGALNLPVKSAMLAAIEQKHGRAMHTFWKETFGYGIDHLTQGEAGHLKSAVSVDAIRDRIAAARYEGIQRLGVAGVPAPARPSQSRAAAISVGESLLNATETAEREQQASLEAAPIEQTYQEALALQVQAKYAQVEKIENRLESLIDRQQVKLQQMQTKAPGMLALPSTRRAWQNQQSQQQARLQTLHVRLDAVREIKEGMGLHAPRIEEMATRKMRAENPKLAADWDAMREAARRRAIHMRQKEKEERAQKAEKTRALTLSLKRPD